MTMPDLEQTLRDRFGLERFRPGQREVIEQVLARRDVLCVMPTGGGKSLCYQLPALLLPGPTLVVSPLIALMKDQVDALTARGVPATFLNSSLDADEQRRRLAEIEAGRYAIVYVAPERFRSPRFIEAMERLRPALLAVDEAHCISEWGHDFRPDYARIGQARRRLGQPPCIALTATATDLVRRDIAEQLDLVDPAQFITGFDRPNLSYRVVAARRESDKLRALGPAIQDCPGPAIIYCSSRKRCTEVAEFLRDEHRLEAVVYHAGLTREERTEAQDRFMNGEVPVIVATNAFGLGVDKPDIRAVVHFNMPGTLEAYYQEAGRAGRDGLPAVCTLLFAQGDRFLQEMFIENEYPSRQVILTIYEFLRRQEADPIELTQAEIRAALNLESNESAVGAALRLLEGAGALEIFRPRENMAILRLNAEPDQLPLSGSLPANATQARRVMEGVESLVGTRLREPVYFYPDDLAATLGIERAALLRALKSLTAQVPLDYIPAFRGNALRIVEPARPGRDLPINYEAHEARKRQEFEKLERMIAYAQTNGCRRAFLLQYFGDRAGASSRCGRCDRCTAGPEGSASGEACRIEHPSQHDLLRKVLSGVARARGRFGKTVVAQMLVGSGAERLQRLGLTSLSTFGLLARKWKLAEVTELLDALAAPGLIELREVDLNRPVIQLTPTGWDYLRAGEPPPIELTLSAEVAVKLRTLAVPAPAPGNREEPPADDAEVGLDADGDPLRERLRALRRHWSTEARLPAYCIFTNETLEELVRLRPRTPHELARIAGIGPARRERYGTALLRAVAECPPVPLPEEPRPPEPFQAQDERPEEITPEQPPDPTRPELDVPSEEWTARLLARGFTVGEIAAIRGLDRAAILRHARLAVANGLRLPLRCFLSEETAARWSRRLAVEGPGAGPPPEAGAAELWPLFMALRESNEVGSAAEHR